MTLQSKNAFKVGASIILAAVIVFFGIRFLQNVPLSGTYDLYTEFERVNGLIKGNKIEISGVDVGSVTRISLDQESQMVRVEMRINNGVYIPEGTTAEQTGISALGTVQVTLHLGPSDNPAIEDGGFLPSASSPDLFTTLTNRVDSTLAGTSATFQQLATMLREPTSDLSQTLASVADLTTQLSQTLEAERPRLSRVLRSTERAMQSVDTLASQSSDSLAITITNLNQTLNELDQTLVSLRGLSGDFGTIAAKINNGQGSLGLLVNDASVYRNLDSTLVNLNRLLVDVRANPKRYLEDLRLVEIF